MIATAVRSIAACAHISRNSWPVTAKIAPNASPVNVAKPRTRKRGSVPPPSTCLLAASLAERGGRATTQGNDLPISFTPVQAGDRRFITQDERQHGRRNDLGNQEEAPHSRA